MRRILAVDDDHDILEILQFILEDSGYKVDTLSDGRLLMETIREKNPDLILLDIMLGNVDGRELCKEVKKRDETHSIPVIMISASHNVGNTVNQENGPNDFVAKPFDINDLLNSIQRQLQAA
ncbi:MULTISPECIES: response regulator [unclassified Mucilaginibacter]|uniref:response regulator n=1 Tax=unclassified Mucilaginibacter TaxID=2617802 RepID=UPI00095DF8B0|nr:MULTISPECIES: response regulator [unclassified Mucilaginibacter]OJW14972.1 MAG: response regulator [Mucilaginibacter sp. 44-25]PLW88223.1 MAG: response regulator [Mucilaginibacter sp.]HEK22169.1 response regulator [Bacteroidota bacterium]